MSITNAAKDSLWPGLFARLAPCPFYALLAGFMFFFNRDPNTWEYWISYGVALYALVMLLYSTRAYFRYRKLGKALLANDASSTLIPAS